MTLITMTGGGLFSPLMGMAFLCEYASSGTTSEPSMRRNSENGGLPSSGGRCPDEIQPVGLFFGASKGIASDEHGGVEASSERLLTTCSREDPSALEFQTFCFNHANSRTPLPAGRTNKRKMQETKLLRTYMTPLPAENPVDLLSWSPSSDNGNEERQVPKRQEYHDPNAGLFSNHSANSYANTQPPPFHQKYVADHHHSEIPLPRELQERDLALDTLHVDKSFSFLHQPVSVNGPVMEEEDVDKKPAACQPTTALDNQRPASMNREDGDRKPAAHQPAAAMDNQKPTSMSRAVAKVENIEEKPAAPVTASATLASDVTLPDMASPGGLWTGELKMFPSRTELDGIQGSRSRAALQSWYERLSELVEFKKQYGHYNVAQKYSNRKLGAFVNKQRSTREDLSAEKVAALDSIGFGWGKKMGQPNWNEHFKKLLAYESKNGDCKYRMRCLGGAFRLVSNSFTFAGRVPTKWEEDPTLGRWVSMQRSHYKDLRAGRKTTMTKERVKKLQDIGFDWQIWRGKKT